MGRYRKKNIKHTKKQFNKFLINEIKNKSGRSIGSHYTPLYHYLDKTTNQHIVRFENLETELNELLNTKYKLGVDIKTISKRNTRSTNNFKVSDFNQKLINLINNVYQLDFEIFAYTQK